MHLSPAKIVIASFGSQSETARAIGVSISAVCKWLVPEERRGRGGRVPGYAMGRLLAAARARGIMLTPEDLLSGRDVPDTLQAPEQAQSEAA